MANSFRRAATLTYPFSNPCGSLAVCRKEHDSALERRTRAAFGHSQLIIMAQFTGLSYVIVLEDCQARTWSVTEMEH